uniref:proline-rich protein 18 n=1 Tax=Euleptes europaea TaxID=460621 RepID=UPI002540BBAA|nr:proline-rich protein 18 [Euleptes europaea]
MSLPPLAPPPAAAPRLQPRQQQQLQRAPRQALRSAKGGGAASSSRPSAPLPPRPGSRGRAAARGRSALARPGSCEALRFSLSLPPEAIGALQRRSREKPPPPPPPPGRASPDAAKRPLAAASKAGGDPRAPLRGSLLRCDDVEDEAAAAAEDGLVRKCTEWLRGVEGAAARGRGDKLGTLPHLSTL